MMVWTNISLDIMPEWKDMRPMNSIDKIETIASLIIEKNINEAKDFVNKNYPHQYIEYDIRNMSIYEKLKIYINDGFIDRYTGNKLIFPNVLRVISYELGNVFPYQSNWKMSECHIAYWELYPTCDHILPIARGGKDVEDNIVTTSMLMNSIKSNFLLTEIGFKLHEKGNIKNWDGMINWYKKYIEDNNNILNDKYVNQWHKALRDFENEFGKI